ncbi:hypothetical protein F5X68DRAFT_277835 [Plectosphaerella plurivora]|uniref:CST complex subunit Stn1 N-terminal domain-containing protein n=1 Tax=Plectosphaerella plurivora TaxID=936078 RepID=A0A9P8V651_9PEZI|nr:hypothetical protein F5X68DRAFT_277835 [Plectosphaerella plurivora]
MTGDAELYPQYCHHLAPTFGQWCLLPTTITRCLDSRFDVFERQNVFFHGNLPIHYARIVGVIVAIDDFPGRHVFTIDDGSGACIETNVQVTKKPSELQGDGFARAYSFAPPELLFKVPECAQLDVGQVVDIKGSLSTFRGEMTMQILKVKILRSTEDEVALWERRTAFQRDVLSKPWVLTERQIRRCRKEAEEDRKVMEKKNRRADEAAKKTTEEPAVDGFGRPIGNRAAGRVPLMDKKRNSGERSPNIARDQRSGEPTAPQEKLKPPKPELDGFGRPVGHKSARRLRMERQSTATTAVPGRPRIIEASISQKPVKPELDGFGRPVGHKRVRRLQDDGQSKATEAEPVRSKDFHAARTRATREQSHVAATPELDGFGRPMGRKSMSSAKPREPPESSHRQRPLQHHQSSVQLDSSEGPELDGFGRPKRRRPAAEVPLAPKPSEEWQTLAEQVGVASRRHPPVHQVSSHPDEVQLDGFGRRKRPKCLN